MSTNYATDYLQKNVIDAGLCTGCGACVNICPYYALANDRIAVIDGCTISDGSCVDICPGMPTDVAALNQLLFEEKDITPEAGAIKAFYVTRAEDKRIRQGAQHGGTVTALMELALQEGLIDTAILSAPEEILQPAGISVEKEQDILNFSKSRFVVTPVIAAFNKQVREGAQSVGVVATPCQTLALAKMRNSRSERIREISTKLRLVIGLFCGWALSSSALRELLMKHVDLNSITGMDIPPSRYHRLEVYTTNGTVTINLDDVEKCVRPNCRSCTDMTAEFSDISVGSARLPEGWEEAKGWNQVIVRTKTGQELLELARRKGILEFRDVPKGNLEKLKSSSLGKKTGEKKVH